MKQFIIIIISLFLFFSCEQKFKTTVLSPNGKVQVEFHNKDKQAQYSIEYNGRAILTPSLLGFKFKNSPALLDDLELYKVDFDTKDETWQPVWGAYANVRNHYNEMKLFLKESSGLRRKLNLVFRVYDDGVGFRYELPKQKNLNQFNITDEITEFCLAGNYTTWWHMANYDSYEYTHVKTPVSDLGKEKYHDESEYGWPAFGEPSFGAANTPITMKTDNDLYLSIHEADLTDYAGMTLERKTDKDYTLKSTLVPWPDGEIKVKGSTPMKTPWRTIQIAEKPGGLIESNLIQNLNDPCAIENTDWIRPAKYCGVWWSLHIGKETWNAGPKHGANTENVKKYIDFAADNGIHYVIAEGWNKYGVCGAESGKPDFITPADDFNMKEILAYCQEKSVEFMAYNETGCDVDVYRSNWDETFSYYHDNNITAIKVGHVGPRLAEKYHHHGQWGVNYYHELMEKTAQYKIGLMVHEPIKPTGLVRTYPHFLTREGVAGMEQDKFDYADPREHAVEIAFTRMLAGPLDYMPGIFDNNLDEYPGMQVKSTVARQLAYYPIFLSGLQCVTDLPENYKNKPAFQFIKDVPVTWNETKVINGEIGDFITIARRSGNDWYIGSLTDEKPRSLDIPLKFLEAGKYSAIIYSDGENADALTNPDPVKIDTISLTQTDIITARMVSGGGQAIKIQPVK